MFDPGDCCHGTCDLLAAGRRRGMRSGTMATRKALLVMTRHLTELATHRGQALCTQQQTPPPAAAEERRWRQMLWCVFFFHHSKCFLVVFNDAARRLIITAVYLSYKRTVSTSDDWCPTGNVCLNSFQSGSTDSSSVGPVTASHVSRRIVGFMAVCAYLSHATLHNLQACLRLQEVFF